jgi:hypothetical protein
VSRSSSKLRAGLVIVLVAGLVGLVALAAPGLPGSGSLGLAGLASRLGVALNPFATSVVRVDADPRASSAVTVAGVGGAASLKVTVSQTTNLVDQTVDVTWSGAPPTVGTPNFAINFMQIMQCWGETSPDPSQCEFGADAAFDTRGGENTASRKLNQASYSDPKEPLTTGLADGENAYLPFQPVAGDAVTGIDTLKNPYYDQSTTNEIPFAATRGDGKGFETFETQTFREAPGLGCGAILTSGKSKGQPRACWLVIVPRGGTEVDGTGPEAVQAQGSHRLDSSPLSATNWASRIVVPLKFAAVGQVCPIAAKQRPLSGAEPAAEAVLRWQPALCRNSGPVFSFAQTADAVAERKLLGSTPGVALLTAPVAPSQVPSDRILVYAPIAVSGISFAVMIERQTPQEAPAATKAQDGERITDLKLTPRLVAKLLTQSYLLDVARNARYLKANPTNITTDPDFLALNPQFKTLTYRDSVETLTPIGLEDSYATLWRWIATDQDAADFVAGLPDPWGMRVNPFYQGTEIPRDDFPKIDPFCDNTGAVGAPPLCTLDNHPYAQDFHDTARSAARGDQLSRSFWDINGTPPAFKKLAPQLNGQRHILAVTDTATAARFGLVTAKLRNAAGQFVAPTRASLAAGLAVMQNTAVTGVVASDPESSNKAAYPLTTVSYAVTAPNILTKAEAKDYALFIRYAAGTGQKLGTGLGNLPDGYLPLTPALRKRALAVAKDVESRRGPAKPAGPGNSNPGGNNGGSGGSGGGSGSGSGSGGPTPIPTTSATSTNGRAVPATAINKATLFTPGDPKVATRDALMIALTLGCCALILGLLLPRLARRLRE